MLLAQEQHHEAACAEKLDSASDFRRSHVHNILGHSSTDDTHGLLGLFGFSASKVRRQEIEADAFAVPLMSASGYNPEAAVQILDGLRRMLWWDISLDHPGFGERIKIVTAEISREARAAWVSTRGLAYGAPGRSS